MRRVNLDEQKQGRIVRLDVELQHLSSQKSSTELSRP